MSATATETVTENTAVSPDAENAPETNDAANSAVNLPDFPQVADPFPSIMYGKVAEKIQRLFEIQKAQKSDDSRPDFKALGDKLSQGKTADDKDADKELAAKYAKLVKAYEKLRDQMRDVRKGMSQVIAEANGLEVVEPDEDADNLKAEFKSTQKLVKEMLKTIRNYADDSGELPEVISFVDEVEKQIPGGKSGAILPTKAAGKAVNTDANKIREWGKTNGYKVSERGRLSEDLVTAYNKANPGGDNSSDENAA